ncbi:MAG TPA: DegV family protein [Acidimicrobiales bacterium]
MRIGVVTDSACDLPSELAQQLDVIVVPLDVRLGATPTEEVRVLAPAEFWKLAARTSELPETSAPSPGAFVEAFLACRDAGAEAVICVTISSALSATYEAARSAASAVAADIRVEVVDSRNATMGEGLLVIEAAALARGSLPFGAIVEQVKSAVDRLHVLGTLDTLDNLRRGGRIGTAQALIGAMLQVKPVIEVRDGVVEGESRQRTRSRSLKYLADKVNTAGPLERLAVMHAAAPDVEEFVAMLSPSALEHPLVISFIGPVIGAHTGAGTIGVCYLRA